MKMWVLLVLIFLKKKNSFYLSSIGYIFLYSHYLVLLLIQMWLLHVDLVAELSSYYILLASDKIFCLLFGSEFNADSKLISAPTLTPIFLF